MVAVDLLLGCGGTAAPPDVILCIVDASNLERNLYLVSQLFELGRPVVLALNKIDLAAEQGWALNTALLRDRLGVSLVPTQAHRQLGLEELKQALLDAAAAANCRGWPRRFPKRSAARWRRSFGSPARADRPPLPRYLVERLLLDVGGYLGAGPAAGRGPGAVGLGPGCPPAVGRGRLAGAGGRDDRALRLGDRRAGRCPDASHRAAEVAQRPPGCGADAQVLGHADLCPADGGRLSVDLCLGGAADGPAGPRLWRGGRPPYGGDAGGRAAFADRRRRDRRRRRRAGLSCRRS